MIRKVTLCLLFASGAASFAPFWTLRRVESQRTRCSLLEMTASSNNEQHRFDHYQILQIPKTATIQEIKDSYRNLAKQYHPDANQSSNAPMKFQEISRAYQILSNTETKQQYDTFLRTLLPGQDLHITIDVDYEMSIRGGDHWVHMRHNAICPKCSGSGTCFQESCTNCQGTGIARVTRRFTVTIPPGIVNRQTLCLREQGMDGTPPGNLYVTVIVMDKDGETDMWSSYESISNVEATVADASRGTRPPDMWQN